MEIKKGDIVGRKSYGKDIIFKVHKIIKIKNGKSFAILKGIHYRIEADAYLEDLEKINKEEAENLTRGIESKIRKRLIEGSKELFAKKSNNLKQTNALILHLDGDKRYTQKSIKYYNKLGLRAIVRNIPENRQPQVIGTLIRRYNPDIVVITRA